MSRDSTVRIALLLPEILGTYGDGGNAVVLAQRLRWRDIPAEVVTVTGADGSVPATCDIYLLGGGEDTAQQYAARHLAEHDGMQRAVEAGAAVLAVCAGFQILGHDFAGSDERAHAGLGMLDVRTRARRRRAVGEIVVEPDPALDPDPRWAQPLTGFENHQGGTVLGPACRRLGRVITGVGNGTDDRAEGAVQGRIVGTYLHGPVLARDPHLADLLLGWVTGTALAPLPLPAVDTLRKARLQEVR